MANNSFLDDLNRKLTALTISTRAGGAAAAGGGGNAAVTAEEVMREVEKWVAAQQEQPRQALEKERKENEALRAHNGMLVAQENMVESLRQQQAATIDLLVARNKELSEENAALTASNAHAAAENAHMRLFLSQGPVAAPRQDPDATQE